MEALLNRLEVACVTGDFSNCNFNIDKEFYRRTTSYDYECIKDIDTITKHIINHEYDIILNTEFFWLKSLKEQTENVEFVSYVKDGVMKSEYLSLFHSTEEDLSYIKQLILLFTAVAALQEFVKANICGPTACLEKEYKIFDKFLPNSGYSDECVLTALSMKSEIILTKIIHPKLLFWSLMLLQSNNFDNCLTHKWWFLRGAMIHQRILPDRVTDLYTMVFYAITAQSVKFLKSKEEPLAAIMFYIECANAHLYYKEFNIAEKFIIKAQNILGFGVKLNRGPITQWRRGNLTYKVLVEVKRNDSRYQSKLTLTQCTFPPNYNDFNDTFLDRIIVTDNNGERITDLLPEEQIILLTYCDLIRKRGAKKLYMEEILSIASILLLHPKIWAIQCKALFVATRNQFSSFTEREKCHNQIKQIKELLTCINNNTPQFSLRQNLLYCVSLPMKYTLEKFIANKFLELGDFENALQSYKKYNLWSGVIKCYKEMNAINEGIEALQTQIDSKFSSILRCNNKPLSILWCYVGDLTENIEAYKTAWEMSGNSDARCQRNLGYYFYKKQMYKSSIYHFKKSLTVNRFQPKVLLTMGLAAQNCNDVDAGMDAFTSLVKIDENNFEAWEYLMKAHIKRNKKTEAFKCLLQCMRDNTNFDYWGIYLLMYTRMNSFTDVIDCYNKLLNYGKDIGIHQVGETHIEVLSSLVNAISNGTPDNHNIPSTHLKPAALSLFEKLTRIGNVGCTSGQIWEMYANLVS